MPPFTGRGQYVEERGDKCPNCVDDVEHVTPFTGRVGLGSAHIRFMFIQGKSLLLYIIVHILTTKRPSSLLRKRPPRFTSPPLIPLLTDRLALIALKDDFGRVDVGTAVAQQLLTPFQRWTLGDVGLVFELNLGLSHRKERVVFVALVVQVLSRVSRARLGKGKDLRIARGRCSQRLLPRHPDIW